MTRYTGPVGAAAFREGCKEMKCNHCPIITNAHPTIFIPVSRLDKNHCALCWVRPRLKGQTVVYTTKSSAHSVGIGQDWKDGLYYIWANALRILFGKARSKNRAYLISTDCNCTKLSSQIRSLHQEARYFNKLGQLSEPLQRFPLGDYPADYSDPISVLVSSVASRHTGVQFAAVVHRVRVHIPHIREFL
jgi:hypothetical protein